MLLKYRYRNVKGVPQNSAEHPRRIPQGVPQYSPQNSTRPFMGTKAMNMPFKTLFNISLYFSASLIKALVFLAINPLIALNMSHYDFALTGFYASFNLLFMPIMGWMFTSYYSSVHFKIGGGQRKKCYATLCSAQLVFGAVELIVILIGFAFYARLQNIEFPFFPYAILSFTSILFTNTFNFLLLIHKLKRDAKKFFNISVCNAAVGVALILLFVVIMKMGALGKILATFVTAMVFGGFAFLKLSNKLAFDTKIIRDAMTFSWPLMIAASMEYFFKGIDLAMLLRLNDTKTLGLYTIAVTMVGYLTIFQNSIQQTFQPDIFQAVAENNKAKICKVLAGINLLYTLPVLVFILSAPLIFKVLTSGRYTEAYHFGRIIVLQQLTAGFYYSLSTLLTAYGYTKITLMNKILGTLLSILLFKVLINTYGFYGAAWGRVFAYVGVSLISFSYLSVKFLQGNK